MLGLKLNHVSTRGPRTLFQYKDLFSGHRNCHYMRCMSLYIPIKIKWSGQHLIFIMGIPILVRWHLFIELGPYIYWNRTVIILVEFSTLPWQEIVILITSEAASDENVIKMTTFMFWWYNSVHLTKCVYHFAMLCFIFVTQSGFVVP